MTCIVGFSDGNKVYIGGDSAGVSGHDVTIRSDEKVFSNGPFLIGFTTSFRMGQLLRYELEIPPQPEGMDDFKYMVTVFIKAVRECLGKGGFLKKNNEVESGGSFLVGYKGKIYEVDDDYQVGTAADNIFAVGCGAKVALGAMYASSGEPTERIRKSLEISEKLNGGVRSPFLIMTLG